MSDIIRNFNWAFSGDYGNAVSYIFNVDIVNRTSSAYNNLMVLLYVSRYPTQGRVKFWQDMRHIACLEPGNGIHITTTTGLIPKGEHISLTVEVFRDGRISDRPYDYVDCINVYTGNL